jgi:hypothetical protein
MVFTLSSDDDRRIEGILACIGTEIQTHCELNGLNERGTQNARSKNVRVQQAAGARNQEQRVWPELSHFSAHAFVNAQTVWIANL